MGEIKDLPFHEAQHRAETARSLATWLVVLLGGMAVHYLLICILAFGGKEEATKSLVCSPMPMTFLIGLAVGLQRWRIRAISIRARGPQPLYRPRIAAAGRW